MKKVFTFIIASGIGLLIYNGAYAQNPVYNWSQQVSGTSNLLYTCKAVSDNICWAAGTNATVRRTTDGGSTWTNANPNPGVIVGDIRNMEAIDENTAWVTTETTMSTKVYRTGNGGNNWVQVYSNTAGFIKGIRMINSMNGIAVGDPINNLWNILLTTDGGITWHSSPTQPAANNIHQGTHNSVQVDMSNIYWGTSFTSIFRSTDGGVTFSEITTPGGGIYMFALKVNSGGFGFVAGTGMSRSTDGGATFQSFTVPGAGNINGIESSADDFWYIRGTKIYRTPNNGANWIDSYTAPYTIYHMDFPDENVSGCQSGWAVGIAGNIYHMSCLMVGVSGISSEVPDNYSLGQNYPNPFNPTTKIDFELPVKSDVKISIYDISGKVVHEYNEGGLSPGKYQYDFNGAELSSGVYFYRFVSDGFTAVRKMILMK